MSTSDPVERHRPDIFVSYRRTDRELVKKLVAAVERLGPSVWWDADIEGGEDWRDSIVEHLAAARCLVIVFSEACNSSEQLRKELAVADHLDKEVIPVLIEPTEPRGFFLYELAPLNWVSIHPAPMEKLDAVARVLVERLEAVGWTAVPMIAPAALAPPPLSAAAAVGLEKSSPVPVQPAVAPFAPPAPPRAAAGAPATTLPPPPLPRAGPVGPTAGGAVPTVPAPPRLGLRDVFPFRWMDFIVPMVLGMVTLVAPEGDGVGVHVGNALLAFVITLAITGMIAFPIRSYRRRSNPYRVARNLVISNVVFALVAFASVAGLVGVEAQLAEGETANEALVNLAVGFVVFGLLIAAVSFVIFLLLSKLRARKMYQEGILRL